MTHRSLVKCAISTLSRGQVTRLNRSAKQLSQQGVMEIVADCGWEIHGDPDGKVTAVLILEGGRALHHQGRFSTIKTANSGPWIYAAGGSQSRRRIVNDSGQTRRDQGRCNA